MFDASISFILFYVCSTEATSLPLSTTNPSSTLYISLQLKALGLCGGGGGHLRGGGHLSLGLRNTGGGLDSGSAGDGDLGEGLVLDEVGAEDSEHAAEDDVNHEEEEGKCRECTGGTVRIVLGLLPKDSSEDKALVRHDEDDTEEETEGEGCLIPAHDERTANRERNHKKDGPEGGELEGPVAA